MTTSSAESPKVFISYTHDSPEHMDRVLELADRLRAEGVDCHLDQYETSPREGWPRWTNRQIEGADYVLIICTEIYQRRFKGTEEAGKGLGAQWEGAHITQELYDAAGNNDKFIPVPLSPADSGHIPHVLRGVQSYDASEEKGYEELYRRLTNQPRVAKPELGSLRPLPTRERKQFFLISSWHIPYKQNPFFTGRDDVLAQLHEALNTKGAAAVSGMPGVGKTQTAVEYAHRHSSEYRLIFWARAETRETLISDFVNIAATLQLPEVRAQEQSFAVGAVKRWFDANPDWLLVLDNADDLALVREFLPTTPKGRIIFTTRAQATGVIATPVPVLKMEEEEGALFLLRRAKILAEDATLESADEGDRKKAIEITREVDGLPLALDQAGAFIEESSSSPAEYLELYKTQGADLRRRRGEHVLGHPESVEITFSLSFDKVEAASPTAADLLRACAFLAPDAIPEEIFTEGGTHLGALLAATVNNRLAFIDTVKETLRYSLLRRDSNERALSNHRVVQDVLKDTMDESTQREWTERTVKAVNHVLPDFDKTAYTHWPVFERLLPQAQACAALIEHWKLKRPEAAQLLNHAARYMHNRGRLSEVEPYYLEALAMRRDLFGQEHLDVAESFYNLAWLRYDQGKYAESETLYLKALDIRTNILGAVNITVADCLSGLGSVKSGQGKYTEAKNYFHKSIDIQEKANCSNTNNMADSLHGLAKVLRGQGRHQETGALLLRALDIKKNLYGEEHVNGTGILSELGYQYYIEEMDAQAEYFLSSAIRIQERVYGINYPRLSDDLDSLARVYIRQKKFSEAEVLLNRALGIAVNTYGRENDHVSTLLGTLGNLYLEKGDLTKAEELYQQGLDIFEKIFGPEHPNAVIILTNIAVSKVEQRNFHQAEQLLQRAITIGKKILPQEHPQLLNSQEMYADLLRRMNRKGEAQRLADYVRKMRGKQGRKKRKR